MIKYTVAIIAIVTAIPALAENGRIGRTSTGSCTIAVTILPQVSAPTIQPEYAVSKNLKDLRVDTNLNDDYTIRRHKVPKKKHGRATGKTTEVLVLMPN